MTEHESERDLINKLVDLKYVYRLDIRDRAALEKNFRQKVEELMHSLVLIAINFS
jgi:type I restriction enzyme R subunit